ncbi:hypothetical protein RV11_GL001705 [Enterococcus phoeniculicola]|jgi:DNA-binding MarR family transcriptional regulator|uniref:HTH marR-type domain-containing protein n=1 Tax=Enterococcus phoeniculicola ATCC BAA-412 TaxID=1158610 RepID=R3TKM1_9ENTE|nr:helix-turn-helix domain-containing protein [Enterococcus phoeniculicola]EOL41959.1 hypothetical protein UC3_02307 [Enterococcus phoeniculicola ATCC BAA-412]EOT79762.1 hypothetical protein I589_01274 [Enterococcus phoeniculicola ATCC BAA-412]OJG70082.1 hypothetical protein RV11_GL001705 [Enterococcus phoeniculicola]
MKEYQNSVRRIALAVNKIDGIYYQAAKKSGIKENVLTLLYALSDHVPRSQKQVSKEWLIPKTTINTIVKECIEAGYVLFLEQTTNKEKMLIITEKGVAQFKQSMHALTQAEAYALSQTEKRNATDFISGIETYANYLEIGLMKE